jgi:phosphate transport system substrate-binding protein
MGYIDDSINLVDVEGVTVNAETVLDGTYPISRPFNMITNGEAEGLAAAFLDFVLGADGQAIIEEEGYVLP